MARAPKYKLDASGILTIVSVPGEPKHIAWAKKANVIARIVQIVALVIMIIIFVSSIGMHVLYGYSEEPEHAEKLEQILHVENGMTVKEAFDKGGEIFLLSAADGTTISKSLSDGYDKFFEDLASVDEEAPASDNQETSEQQPLPEQPTEQQ